MELHHDWKEKQTNTSEDIQQIYKIINEQIQTNSKEVMYSLNQRAERTIQLKLDQDFEH